MMLRKTRIRMSYRVRDTKASMRPQHDAAENEWVDSDDSLQRGFNEAAA